MTPLYKGRCTSEELAIKFHEWIAPKPDWLTGTEAALTVDEYVAQLTLEQVIRAEKRMNERLPTLEDFRTQHDAVIANPGVAVTGLAAVLRANVGKAVVVEVNFDRLVETHCPVRYRVFYSVDDFLEAADYVSAYLDGTETAIPILKLHGDINDPPTCVVSTAQTELGIGDAKLNALRALLNPGQPRLWIYVGASMRDRDLLPILSDEDFATGVEEKWVLPYLSDTVEAFAAGRAPYWRDSRRLKTIDERIVTETADAFFEAWQASLTP
jgi:hypothetical protein